MWLDGTLLSPTLTNAYQYSIWYLSNAIANDEEGDGGVDDNSVNVIDIVDSFNLQELTLSKAEWTAYVKTYLPKIKKALEAAGKTERIPVFQKGATAFVKHIIEKFDEVQIFAGKGFDVEAGLAYCYYKEQTDAGPTFFFFNDGMKEEKFWISQNNSIPQYG